MKAADSVTLVARAVCSSCSLDKGPRTQHYVYLVTEVPFRIFEVLKNNQRKKLAKITGACAAGNFQVTATGKVGLRDDHNTILISEFTTKQIAEGSTTGTL